MRQMGTTEYAAWQESIVSILCGSCDCVVEADTLEDLTEQVVRRHTLRFRNLPEAAEVWDRLLAMEEDIQDCVRSGRLWSWEDGAMKSVESYVTLYLSLLEMLVGEVKKRKGKDCGELIQLLELLMRWKCCMLNLENVLLIPPCHPIEMVSRVLTKCPRESEDGELANAVKRIRRKGQARYQIALSDQVFLRNHNEENTICQPKC